MKLSRLIKEDWYLDKKRNEEKSNIDAPVLSKEDKSKFIEMVGKYNEYGKKIYNEHDLVEIANDLSRISNMAEAITMSSVDENFDKITVQRNIKELKHMSGQFSKVATEAQSLKQRMTGLYEDMGNILGRYFDIKEDSNIKLSDNNSKNKNIEEVTVAKKDTATMLSIIKYDLDSFLRSLGGNSPRTDIDTTDNSVDGEVRFLGNWISNEDDPYRDENDYEDDDFQIWAPGEHAKYTKKFTEWSKTKKWYKYVTLQVYDGEKNWAIFSIKLK